MKKKCLWSMLTIMMVAMLSVSMSSCSKDDSDSKKTGPFAGTVWAESASKTSEQLLFYHFKSDGMYDFGPMIKGKDGKWYKHVNHTFEYSVSGDYLTMQRGEAKVKGKYEISGDYLMITLGGEASPMVYERLKGDLLDAFNHAEEIKD